MGLLNNYEEAYGNMIWYLFLAVQEGAVPMSEERKLVTILFADVTGSTALSAWGGRKDTKRGRKAPVST